MDELKTALGTEIPITTRAIMYFCTYNSAKKKLTVMNEIVSDNAYEVLECYANIHNPESQMVSGKDYNELINNLLKLHANMKNKMWLTQLEECM